MRLFRVAHRLESRSASGFPAHALVAPNFLRSDYIALAAITANILLNVYFLFATSLGLVGIALASSLSGWLNAALLGAILYRRGQWVPDGRLISRGIRIVCATAGMGVALWLGLLWLAKPLSRADIEGGMALAGICLIGILAYAVVGAALGVVRISELRYVMRRQPGLTSADPGEQP